MRHTILDTVYLHTLYSFYKKKKKKACQPPSDKPEQSVTRVKSLGWKGFFDGDD